MRVLAIRGANLASLSRDFAVELTSPPLSEAGLFAITGRVGAGKTTLLDAVCLALFDRTPRLSGRGGAPVADPSTDERDWLSSNDPRTVLRRGATAGFAEVDFRGRDGRAYRARWSVHRARRRVEGRLQAQEVSLRDLATGRTIGGRKTEVLQAIQDRLGLNFEQFCRSVLLAQGEFAAFLEAKPAERAELLERMTGTGIFRRLSVAAHERHRQERALLQALEDNAKGHHTLDPDARAALEAKAQQAESVVEDLQEQEAAAQRAWSWHETAERWMRQESLALRDLRQAREREATAARRRAALERVKAVRPLRPRWEALQQAESEWQEARASLARAEREAREADTARDAARTALREVQLALRAGDEPQRVGEWSDRHRDGVPLAREFERFGPALRRYRDAAARTADLEERRPRLSEDLERQAGVVRAAGESLLAARDRQQRAAAARAAARDELQAFPEADLRRRRQAASRHGELLGRLQSVFAEWRARDAALRRIEAELGRCRARLDRASSAGKEQAEGLPAIERELKRARAELRRAEAGQDLAVHRARLEPGEPCPLCGATEHPLSDHPAGAGGTEACREVRFRVNELEADLARRLTEAGRKLQEQRNLQERLGDLEQERSVEWEAFVAVRREWARVAAGSRDWDGEPDGSVEERLRAAAGDHGAEVRAIEAGEEAVRRLREVASAAEAEHLQAIDEAQAAGEALREAERELRARERALEDLSAELRVAAAARDELAAALDPAFDFDGWRGRAAVDPARFFARCEELARRGAALREAEAASTGARVAMEQTAREERARAERRDRAAAQWEAAAAELDLGPEELVQALDKDDAWIRAETEALAEITAGVQQARAVLLERRERRKEHEDSDRPSLGPAEAKRRLGEVRRRQEEARKKAAEVRVQIDRDDWTRRLLAELQPRLESQREVAKLWATMDELIGSARGDKFQIFAQSLTMDLLVEQANLRLSELARRYRLRRVPGEDMDLVVVDLDMGEAVRSIRTLSGGESFLVSLALALALASLSSQRTRVETLFIDEGFGSLDAQSLETALAALDALQATGCQVGVISHVEGLAERIGVRVEVTADGRGASLLRVQ